MGKRKFSIISGLFLILVLFLFLSFTHFKENRTSDLNLTEICADSNSCPSQYCTHACTDAGSAFGCVRSCTPKDCYRDFNAQNCPVGKNCEIWQTLQGEKVCYYNQADTDDKCGKAGYYGQKIECCDGYIRGIGVQRKDGSCDMTKGGVDDMFPVCIACGDGECSTLENACSCPVDCGG